MIEAEKQELLPQEYVWLQESNRRPLFITIGRLIQQKGQWHLIRAFTQVVKQYPRATLLILGEGEYRDKLQTLIADCDLQDHVFLLGNHSNVYQFLNQADVFVFSSLWEGMPNTMLEALAVGLPIVSTDCISGPREIIAPELDINEDIAYPYTNQLGILTKTPENLPPIWNAPTTTPLTKEEAQLATAILAMSEHKNANTNNTHHTRAHDFAYEQIMQEWEKLF